MIQVRVTTGEYRPRMIELGYTIAEFGTHEEATEFARWVQRNYARLRREYEADKREAQRGTASDHGPQVTTGDAHGNQTV